MVRKISFVAFTLLTALASFGQDLDFTEVKRLPVTINSPAEEGMPLLTADGNRLYFTRALYEGNEGGEYSGSDIWFAEQKNGNWAKASNSLSVNNKNHNVITGIGGDGKTVYYLDVSPAKKLQGIYFSTVLNNRWGHPELIPLSGIDNLDFLGVFVAPKGDLIFLSMKAADSRGNEDLYYTMKDKSGLWSTPRNLGASINTPGFEISPFLSEDGKRLYFSSNGHGGEGDADIFYSERLYNSWETWSTPVNLGKTINSKKFDAYFSIYGDSLAFFASNKESNMADIYSVKVQQKQTILAKGQHYLNTEEWGNLIGKKISSNISFPPEITTLTEPQQELLFYIVNKVMLEKDINFHLIVSEEESPEMTKARLESVTSHMTKSGIDASRIRNEQVASIKKSDKGMIEIRLFK